jgi:hypothetical protein
MHSTVSAALYAPAHRSNKLVFCIRIQYITSRTIIVKIWKVVTTFLQAASRLPLVEFPENSNLSLYAHSPRTM